MYTHCYCCHRTSVSLVTTWSSKKKKGLLSWQNRWPTLICSMKVKSLDIDCILNRFLKDAFKYNQRNIVKM